LLCSDPSVVPQILCELEIEEARSLFLRCSVHGDEAVSPEDFLEKPVHVLQEEQAASMDELADFNEQMQKAAQTGATASLEQHKEQEQEKQQIDIVETKDASDCENGLPNSTVGSS